MAVIGSQYDPNKAMRSSSYAFECWYNVKFEKNTIGMTDEQKDEFDDRWEDWYSEWTKDVNADHTEYEISDEDWDASKLEGAEETEEACGNDGKIIDDIAITTGNTVLSASGAGATVGAITFGVASNKAAALATALEKFKDNPITKKLAEILKEKAEELANASKAMCFVGCAISLAVGTLYEVLRPNKDSYEALMSLNDELVKANDDIDFDKAQLDAMSEVITQQAESAENEQQAKEKELEQKAILLFAATMYREEIRARIEGGEQISPAEMAKYEETGVLLGQLQSEVEALKTELGVSKEEITDNINAKQQEYNLIAERIAKTVGMTEFIARFDQATRNLCITEAAMQSLNVVNGAVAGAKALKYGPWGWAFAAMGFIGAGMSAHGAIEQGIFASNLKKIIDLRVDTQAKVETATQSYYTALDKYAVDMEVVNKVDLDIEDESTAISEELAISTPTPTLTPATSNISTNPFLGEKPEEEEPII